MSSQHKRGKKGFSLIELVIVVVIIGIVAAIAIPRLSRGSAGASESALAADLKVLRNAIEMYATEHDGNWPNPATVEAQLTQYTDAAGETSATRTATHIYGPYMRKVPPVPVGPFKGTTTIGDSDTVNQGTDGFGWIYNGTTGEIHANTDTAKDARGTFYKDY
jgi:prepilin-type N-terminal cleavage/methylation domain-containing protein